MAAKFQDYYEILGLKRDATEKEIKAAYRKLARKWHPDLHPPSEKNKVEEKFKKINEAYEVLMDKDKRARYDQLGSRWQDGQDFQAPPDMDGVRYYSSSSDFGGDFQGAGGFSDFFSMMFGDLGSRARGGTRRGTTSVKGEDVESEISISLEEAYHGTVKPIRLSGSKVCEQCRGSAIVGNSFCPRCGGTGAVTEEKSLDVKIPAGVQEKGRIRLKGQGGKGLGSAPPGDLYLKINILPHKYFRLKGKDVESEVSIRPDQAVNGDKVTVRTLDGDINMTIPPNSNSGKKLRLRDKGFFGKNKVRGDHYVKIKIIIPLDLSDEEKELYRKLMDLRKKGD